MVFVYELPYSVKKKVCDILDVDDKWKELGCRLNFTILQLQIFARAVLGARSPTEEMLTDWGHRNGTIDELFCTLACLSHKEAMNVLLPFTDPQYHFLMDKGPDFMPNLDEKKMANKGGLFMTNAEKDMEKQLNTKFPTAKANFNVLDDGLVAEGACGFSKNANKGNGSINLSFSRINNLEPKNVNQKISNLNTPKCEKVINLPAEKTKPTVAVGENRIDVNEVFQSLKGVVNIPYSELEVATDNFSNSNLLGHGGFGMVYLARWKKNVVAVKKLSPKDPKNESIKEEISLKQTLNELKILNSCRMDNILPLYGLSLFSGKDPCLVYQYMENGSLEDRLLLKKNTPPLSWLTRAKIAEGTSRGLHFLHTFPGKVLIHGDIKSANILLDKNMEPKIGDFGLAREGPSGNKTSTKVMHIQGTRVYLPLEYQRSGRLSTKTDVYSFGVVLLEMATGERAYDDKRPKLKLLVDYVMEKVKSTNDRMLLADPNAGQENMSWYFKLLDLGLQCSKPVRSERPDMDSVLDDISNALRAAHLNLHTSPPTGNIHISPLDMQIRHDMQNRVLTNCPMNNCQLPSNASPINISLSPTPKPFAVNSPTNNRSYNPPFLASPTDTANFCLQMEKVSLASAIPSNAEQVANNSNSQPPNHVFTPIPIAIQSASNVAEAQIDSHLPDFSGLMKDSSNNSSLHHESLDNNSRMDTEYL